MLTWIVLSLAGLFTLALLYVGFFQDRSRGRPRCPKCWYNMTGAPSLVCPECGGNARCERRLYRTRRRRWSIASAVFLVFCWMYLWQVHSRVVNLHESIHSAMTPTLYSLFTLQKSSRADLECLEARLKDSRVWPWETWLLVMQWDHHFNSSLSLDRWNVFQLLTLAAKSSDRALARVFACHIDSSKSVEETAFAALSRHAKRLTDPQIVELFETQMHLAESCSFPHGFQDGFMQEMIRRHRPEFRERIAWWAANPPVLDLRNILSQTSTSRPFDGLFRIPLNLELVTALRRFDGKPDPLRIFLSGDQVSECKSLRLPTIRVTALNVDASGTDIGFERAGDYRGGRHARWRFEVRDERGHTLPIRSRLSNTGGGLSAYTTLHPGDRFTRSLDMNRYVQPLPPGRYRVVVQYHNSHTIADDEDVSDRIVSSSDPFELIVGGE